MAGNEPIAANLFLWEGLTPAVDYSYPNGDRDAHPIRLEDWPALARLEEAGALTFADDDLRRRYERMKPTD